MLVQSRQKGTWEVMKAAQRQSPKYTLTHWQHQTKVRDSTHVPRNADTNLDHQHNKLQEVFDYFSNLTARSSGNTPWPQQIWKGVKLQFVSIFFWQNVWSCLVTENGRRDSYGTDFHSCFAHLSKTIWGWQHSCAPFGGPPRYLHGHTLSSIIWWTLGGSGILKQNYLKQIKTNVSVLSRGLDGATHLGNSYLHFHSPKPLQVICLWSSVSETTMCWQECLGMILKCF